MRRISAILILIIFACSLVSCGGKKEKVYANTTWHMDTFFSYTLYGRNGEKVFGELEQTVDDAEKVFDCYLEDSEISAVNASTETEDIEISRDLYEVLVIALDGYRKSDMCFDPTVGRLVQLWGFGTDKPYLPSDEEIKEALQYVGGAKVKLTEKDGKYYISRPDGLLLDLGGIAKGYTLSKMADVLKESRLSDAVISVGGNVLLYGDREVSVGIRRPHKDALDPVCTFTLSDCVVSTTGSYERFFVQHGKEYCHIIDPKTGRSVQGEMVSLSVVCDDPTQADLLSTAYFVKGMKAAVQAIKDGELEGVILTEDGRMLCSEGLAGKLEDGSVADGWTWEVIPHEA